MSVQFGPPLALARFELRDDPAGERIDAREADASPEPLLTVAQFAERLGVSERTLHRRIADGTVRVLKLGRLVRIHPSELARLLGGPAGGKAESRDEAQEPARLCEHPSSNAEGCYSSVRTTGNPWQDLAR